VPSSRPRIPTGGPPDIEVAHLQKDAEWPRSGARAALAAHACNDVTTRYGARSLRAMLTQRLRAQPAACLMLGDDEG
jgi:hypothetical protein